jgi:hypothetical protein
VSKLQTDWHWRKDLMTQVQKSWSTGFEVQGTHYFGWRSWQAQEYDLHLRMELRSILVGLRSLHSPNACKGEGMSTAKIDK